MLSLSNIFKYIYFGKNYDEKKCVCFIVHFVTWLIKLKHFFHEYETSMTTVKNKCTLAYLKYLL